MGAIRTMSPIPHVRDFCIRSCDAATLPQNERHRNLEIGGRVLDFRKNMQGGDRMRLLQLCGIALCAVAASGFALRPAAAESIAGFYGGKTVRVIIPASMGGSVAVYGRLMADHIGRHIPGHPTVVAAAMPGAGGVQSVDYIFNAAPKDGTVIGEILSPSVLVPMLGGAKFDARKIRWLGSLAARPGVVAVWHTARATTLEQAKTTPLNFGSTGVGAGNFQIPTLADAVLGTRFKVVMGYPGGAEINLAIEKGELDGRFNYWSGWTSAKPDWVRDRKLVFLFRTGPPAPDMPAGLPAFGDLVSGQDRQMVQLAEAPDNIGVGFWAAPGLPPDRFAALQKALEDTTRDPDFLAAAQKLRTPIAPVPAAELSKIVATLYATPAPVVDRFKQLTTPKH
jgi:tripartite-type tricarboxylate transporter receptor subunit TctC